MTYQVRTEVRPCKDGFDGTVYVLEAGGAKAEIWPALGFNCFSWKVQHQGKPVELLWSDPNLFHNPQPTRSGIPILFPFPNRIRGGHFTWEGKKYQLPINDPQKKNAIHGFACFRPWPATLPYRLTLPPQQRTIVCDFMGEFQGSLHARDRMGLWPADYRLTIFYDLSDSQLRINASVKNLDITEPLPFGLGFHPYFQFPAETSIFHLPLASRDRSCLDRWALEECLPTGAHLQLEGKHRRLVEKAMWEPETNPGQRPGLTWDDAYHYNESPREKLLLSLEDRSRNLLLQIECSESFRDFVIFTPPHREAVCIEPYTCVTDAINLHNQGLDSGLIVLPPGGEWHGSITLTVQSL